MPIKLRHTFPYLPVLSSISFYIIFQNSCLSRYLQAVRLPPQNSAHARKLGERLTARKNPIDVGS
ncbi:hypothetical protein COD67_15425 [Bacillus cereus]|nr:hypothetical protein COD67_15425 [Bacillus cereus]